MSEEMNGTIVVQETFPTIPIKNVLTDCPSITSIASEESLPSKQEHCLTTSQDLFNVIVVNIYGFDDYEDDTYVITRTVENTTNLGEENNIGKNNGISSNTNNTTSTSNLESNLQPGRVNNENTSNGVDNSVNCINICDVEGMENGMYIIIYLSENITETLESRIEVLKEHTDHKSKLELIMNVKERCVTMEDDNSTNLTENSAICISISGMDGIRNGNYLAIRMKKSRSLSLDSSIDASNKSLP